MYMKRKYSQGKERTVAKKLRTGGLLVLGMIVERRTGKRGMDEVEKPVGRERLFESTF